MARNACHTCICILAYVKYVCVIMIIPCDSYDVISSRLLFSLLASVCDTQFSWRSILGMTDHVTAIA